MSNRVRTRDQLWAQFPDNVTRLIKAIDGRDLIATMFGFMMGGPPNASCDSVDTLNLGAWFSAGSRWIDTAAKRVWFCLDGTPLAAKWQAMMYDGQSAGGSLSGTYPNPTIAASGATAGTYGGPSTYASFSVNAAGQITAAASNALPAGGVTSVNVAGPAGTTATGGPVTGSGVIAINWDSVSPGVVFGKSAGTGSGAPGYFALDPLDIPDLPAAIITSGTFGVGLIPNLPASIITSGTFGTSQIPDLPASIITSGTFGVGLIPSLPASIITSGTFGTSQIPGLPASQITSGVFTNSSLFSLDASIISSGMFSTSQIPNLSAAFITSGLFTNSALFSLNASIITGGVFTNSALFALDCSILTSGSLAVARLPAGVPVGGTIGRFSQWGLYTITRADLAVAATSITLTLQTLPAGAVLEAYALFYDTGFSGGGVNPQLSIGFAGGQFVPASNTSAYLFNSFMGTASNSAPTINNFGAGGPQDMVGTWTLTATITGSANLNLLTAGTLRLWVRISQLT